MSKITIEIKGPRQSGKSVIASFIKKQLEDKGYIVTNNDQNEEYRLLEPNYKKPSVVINVNN